MAPGRDVVVLTDRGRGEAKSDHRFTKVPCGERAAGSRFQIPLEAFRRCGICELQRDDN
jgi:hypothetical protein